MRARESLVSASRPLLVLAVVLGWVRAGAGIGLVLWATALLTDPAEPRLLVAALLVGLRMAAAALTPIVAAAAATRVETDLRSRVFRKVMELGPVDRRTGELVSSATTGVEAVGAYAGSFLPMLINGITVPLLIIGVIATLDLRTALVLLVVVPLVPGLLRFMERRFQSVSDRYRSNADRLAGRFLDALQGLTSLKAFGRARSYGEELVRESEELRVATIRLLRVNQLALFAVDSLFALATVVAATVVVVLGTFGEGLDPGSLAIVLLAALLIDALAQIGRFFYVGAIGRASARSVRGFLELPTPSRRPLEPPAAGDGSVELEQVRFSYPGGRPVLDGASLRVQPGEVAALVGPSGAGKTTIVHLLLGFLEPDEGHVRVGGWRLDEVGREWGRRQIALVPQSPHLFAGSLADNLRLARPDASLEAMEEAARAAHLLEVVDRLPRGWDTEVGERGSSLSGGEAQRVAIARALLRNAPIVVLDEPASNVDLESEHAIRAGTARLVEGRTVLVIAHRYSTVSGADRVLVLQGGRIVAEGPPGELAGREGLFRRMARPSEVGT